MNLLFWRREESTPNGYAPYEQIEAKRTSKLGYFFLVLMVIFGVWQGNNFLQALQNVIERPEPNSYCLSTLLSYTQQNRSYDYYDPYYYGNAGFESCTVSARERALALDIAYRELAPLTSKIAAQQRDLSRITDELSSLKNSRASAASDYQLSLLEDVTGISRRVFDPVTLQQQIVSLDEYRRELERVQAERQQILTRLESERTQAATRYATAATAAQDQYQHERMVQELTQFVVALLFITPLFIFSWKRYHTARRALSPYTIIWGGALATFSLLLAQILLVFVYEILPRELIERIFSFLAAFDVLWALLYWVGFILVPAFFGFLIYLIQKKFYNKQAVMMRALKSGHCPGCSLKITPTMNFCPICSHPLKERCPHCSAMTLAGSNFCETCGNSTTQYSSTS